MTSDLNKAPARHLAIIGTAGRDKSKPMHLPLWEAMTADLKNRILPSDVLISGGAAWADHLAVHAFLEGWCTGLELFLPAPFVDGKFQGPSQSAASAANYYHELFSKACRLDSPGQLRDAVVTGAVVTAQPRQAGYAAMFARNHQVASACTSVVAYTFGEGGQPADGGTLDTWRQIRGADKVHVPLASINLLGKHPCKPLTN
jgi:DNA helicase II / ATP-dependent DNA helicase PcrA